MTTAFDPTQREKQLKLLAEFLKQQVPAADGVEITPQTALLGTGLLDSLAVIQLMLFLGNEFGIDIEDDDFTPENLADVGSLLDFISRKQAPTA
jgi:acyl carrier protein